MDAPVVQPPAQLGKPTQEPATCLEPLLEIVGRPACGLGVWRVAREPAAHCLRCGSRMESSRWMPLCEEWLERGLPCSK